MQPALLVTFDASTPNARFCALIRMIKRTHPAIQSAKSVLPNARRLLVPVALVSSDTVQPPSRARNPNCLVQHKLGMAEYVMLYKTFFSSFFLLLLQYSQATGRSRNEVGARSFSGQSVVIPQAAAAHPTCEDNGIGRPRSKRGQTKPLLSLLSPRWKSQHKSIPYTTTHTPRTTVQPWNKSLIKLSEGGDHGMLPFPPPLACSGKAALLVDHPPSRRRPSSAWNLGAWEPGSVRGTFPPRVSVWLDPLVPRKRPQPGAETLFPVLPAHRTAVIHRNLLLAELTLGSSLSSRA